ncbi:ribonuclease E/G [Minwuia sp.]|uniref:ribonuclease E/G n=1 Tax=Minwuia sp. TaxID=2493630 RepID=UPI003A8CE84F
MNRSLFIDRGVLETRVAVIEDERIVEVHIERDGQAVAVQGEIRAARVTHVSSELQAATVDAGDGLSLFLRAADARVLADADAPKKLPINRLVKRGQNLLVQVGRPATEGKQARCSVDIVLGGRYVVLHPMRTGFEPGKRPVDEALAAAVAELADTARITVRPPAHRVDPETVLQEVRRLLDEWNAVASVSVPKPALLRPAPDLLHRAVTHLAGPDPDSIMVPDRATQSELKLLARQMAPDLADRITLTGLQRSIDLDDEIEGALAVEIGLSDKAGLSIEPTRAMTVIDIDGQGQGVDVNLTAVPEIARQLRLRRIGGPVAIDFISMSRAPERKRVETALRQAVQRDPEQVDIGSIDRFGICTLVRRRSGLSLHEDLAETRIGAVTLKPRTVLAQVLRRVEAELAQIGPLPVVVSLSDALKADAPDDLQDRLNDRLGRPLRIAFVESAIDAFSISREK